MAPPRGSPIRPHTPATPHRRGTSGRAATARPRLKMTMPAGTRSRPAMFRRRMHLIVEDLRASSQRCRAGSSPAPVERRRCCGSLPRRPCRQRAEGKSRRAGQRTHHGQADHHRCLRYPRPRRERQPVVAPGRHPGGRRHPVTRGCPRGAGGQLRHRYGAEADWLHGIPREHVRRLRRSGTPMPKVYAAAALC